MCVQIKKDIHPDYVIKMIREAMEIDFSSWGLPPLYLGGNVGYNWKDGKADGLEAPVALMDRMIENANYHLENNIPFPHIDDQKEYWSDEIIKYNLEVLDTQSKIGYVDPEDPDAQRILPINDLDDAMKSVRIAKYSQHDAYKGKGTYILGMVMMKGHDFVRENLSNLLDNGENLSISTLNRSKEKYNDYESARESLGLRTCAEWFGKYGGDILNYSLTKDIEKVEFKTIGKGKKSVTHCYITGVDGTITHLEKSEYPLQKVAPVLKGQELVDYELSLKEEVEQMFDYNKSLNVLSIKADKITPKTLSSIFGLLIGTAQLKSMLQNPSTESVNVSIVMDNIEPKTLQGKQLVVDFIPIVKKLIYMDLIGKVDFDSVNNDFMEIGSKLFK